MPLLHMPRPLAQPATAEAPAEIVIGVVATPGSVHRPDGADVRPAVEAAFVAAARPAAGGIGAITGRQARIVAVEDDCTRTSGEEAARRLVGEQASVVIGHVCAGAAIAAAPVYQAAGVLFIAPGVRHPRLTEPRAGPLVFRLAGRSDRLARDMVAVAAARHEGRRLAIVHDRSAQARGLADALERALAPGKAELRLDFTSGETSYRAVAERIARSEAEVLLVPAQPIELGLVLDAMAGLGRRPAVIGGEALAVPDLAPVAGRHGPRLTLMLPWPAGVGHHGAHGSDRAARGTSSTHVLATAAFETWLGAVVATGSTVPATVARQLVDGATATRLGPIRFDAGGDAQVPSYAPHRWFEGRWTPL